MMIAVAEPGSAISQVLVPSRVIGEGVGASTTVHVPALVDAPTEVVAPAGAPTPLPSNVPENPPASSSPLKTAGLVVGGVGVAGLVVGGIFGAIAISKNSSANSGHCGGSLGGPNQCDPTGVGLRSDAVNAGNISTIAFIAGGAVLATGAVLFFSAPREASRVQLGFSAGGVALRARF